jgi:hypothetical protein
MSKDNLGLYDDGHEYCFGCGYYKPPTKYMAAAENTKVKPKVPIAYQHGSQLLPTIAWAWLAKGGITAEHVQTRGLRFSRVNNSLFIPLNHIYDNPVFTEKTFNADEPKYRTHGNVKHILPYYPRNGYYPAKHFEGTVVLVEDALSALRISKYCACAPLLGTTPHKHLVEYAVERGDNLLLWLDSNKAADSLRWTEKARVMYPKILIRSIISSLDPKEYSDEPILQFLCAALKNSIGNNSLQPNSSKLRIEEVRTT